jgi:hypothetical protein
MKTATIEAVACFTSWEDTHLLGSGNGEVEKRLCCRSDVLDHIALFLIPHGVDPARIEIEMNEEWADAIGMTLAELRNAASDLTAGTMVDFGDKLVVRLTIERQ